MSTDVSQIVTVTGTPRTGAMSTRLVGSEILKIAGEVRELAAKGRTLCDLTVGDFSPKEFPIPDVLLNGTIAALKEGQTNYPPSDGVLELREAVRDHVARTTGVTYPLQSVLICGGARPVLYGAYRAMLNPGDKVVYPLPSWNNNHYMVLAGAQAVEVPTRSEDGFFPSVDAFLPHLPTARVVFLNSPLNPAGTLVTKQNLKALCQAVVDENRAREKDGRPTLFFMYDQVYAALVFGGQEHAFPAALVPEVARYTLIIDGISKSMAATGLRVGWAIGPTDVVDRMKAILGHVGAWAPRAEQVATARLLRDHAAVDAFQKHYLGGLETRLGGLYRGLQALKERGQPVDAINPQGAIYLSLRFNLLGKKTADGTVLNSGEAIRRWLLEAAGAAVVPFSAFGMPQEPTWFRASVGAVSPGTIEALMPRLEAALRTLT